MPGHGDGQGKQATKKSLAKMIRDKKYSKLRPYVFTPQGVAIHLFSSYKTNRSSYRLGRPYLR